MSFTERSTNPHLPVARFLSAGVPARLVMLDTWQRRWELIVARVSA
jgi:hypothetical protein